MTKLTIEQTKEEYRNDSSVNPSLLWEKRKQNKVNQRALQDSNPGVSVKQPSFKQMAIGKYCHYRG